MFKVYLTILSIFTLTNLSAHASPISRLSNSAFLGVGAAILRASAPSLLMNGIQSYSSSSTVQQRGQDDIPLQQQFSTIPTETKEHSGESPLRNRLSSEVQSFSFFDDCLRKKIRDAAEDGEETKMITVDLRRINGFDSYRLDSGKLPSSLLRIAFTDSPDLPEDLQYLRFPPSDSELILGAYFVNTNCLLTTTLGFFPQFDKASRSDFIAMIRKDLKTLIDRMQGKSTEEKLIEIIGLTNKLIKYADGYSTSLMSYNRTFDKTIRCGKGCCVDFSILVSVFAMVFDDIDPLLVADNDGHAFIIAHQENGEFVAYEPQIYNGTLFKFTNIVFNSGLRSKL